jgi:hypothetical protein
MEIIDSGVGPMLQPPDLDAFWRLQGHSGC